MNLRTVRAIGGCIAILFWNVVLGKWDDGASWLGGDAPGIGDTGVIGHGIFTNSTVDFEGLYLENQTIDVVAANQLSFKGTVLGPNATLRTTDTDGLTISVVNYAELNGPVQLEGQTSLYLVPDTTAVFINAGTMTVNAPVTVMGAGTFVNSGTIEIAPPADEPSALAALNVPSIGVITQNDGLITLTGAASAPAGNATATFENVTGSGTVRAANAEVTFLGEVTGGTFEFADTAAVLRLNSPANFGAVIKGFLLGNTISLGFLAADGLNYVPDGGGTTGTLQIQSGGFTVATLAFQGTYTNGDFLLGDAGGGEIILTTFVPCFAEGTLLRTARGEVAVEDIAVGDVLPTRLGGADARVVWTGWRRVACGRHPRPHDVMPVRVREHAFAPGVPARDVVLSPDHAVFHDGVLIPVRYLLNDATIVQEAVADITYWHVELERHDVIEAAGLAVESYLDTGNRGDFANGPVPRSLHPDFGRQAAAMAVWDAAACAPLRLGGPEVIAAQRHLLARAEALGWRRVPGAAPRVVVDGREVAPVVDGAAWLVPLPRGARRLRLESASGVPQHLRPGGADGRRLGVAVAGLLWDGVPAGLDDARLGAGWHAAEAEWRWTDGGGEIDVAGLGDIGFTLVAVEWCWVAPATVAPGALTVDAAAVRRVA